MIVKICVLIACALAAGCATPAQRKAAEKETVQKQAAEEVKRICALPEAERRAEIEKMNLSNFDLYCSKE